MQMIYTWILLNFLTPNLQGGIKLAELDNIIYRHSDYLNSPCQLYLYKNKSYTYWCEHNPSGESVGIYFYSIGTYNRIDKTIVLKDKNTANEIVFNVRNDSLVSRITYLPFIDQVLILDTAPSTIFNFDLNSDKPILEISSIPDSVFVNPSTVKAGSYINENDLIEINIYSDYRFEYFVDNKLLMMGQYYIEGNCVILIDELTNIHMQFLSYEENLIGETFLPCSINSLDYIFRERTGFKKNY